MNCIPPDKVGAVEAALLDGGSVRAVAVGVDKNTVSRYRRLIADQLPKSADESETLYTFLERRERELLALRDFLLIEVLDPVSRELLDLQACRAHLPEAGKAMLEASEEPVEPVSAVLAAAAPDPSPETLADASEPLEGSEVEVVVEEREAPAEEIALDASGTDEFDVAFMPKSAGAIPSVLRCLAGWMEKFPPGPTIKQVATETRLSVEDIRLAFWEIREQHLATVYKSRDDHALHLAPLGFDYEAGDLSPNQEKVLGYLTTLPKDKDGAVTPSSSNNVHVATGVPVGSLGAVVQDLERKGKIEVLQRGSGSLQKPRYKVVQRLELRHEVRPVVRDASHLVFDDPPPGRSALDEKRLQD